MKNLLKKLIPKPILLFYHKVLALSAAFFYGFPSKKMVVIGVTGTTGKTSVCNMAAKILEEAGFKVGLATTVNFKIGSKEWINSTKQTMLGRFRLQKLLWQMVDEKCDYAVIETSSEGILQSRHLGIDYDVAVFTNLSPEHIESHGSYEKYRQAKEKLFESLKQKNPSTTLGAGKKTLRLRLGQVKKPFDYAWGRQKNKKARKISVINLDDPSAGYFLKYDADEKYGYRINKSKIKNLASQACGELAGRQKSKIQIKNAKIIEAEKVQLGSSGSEFMIHDSKFVIPLLGEFNIYNALAAICIGLSQDVNLKVAAVALKKIKVMPGRMELINEGQPFKVIVDYAHEPKGLENVYRTIRDSFVNIHKVLKRPKIISVLGACGGGRDRSKRPILGKLASKYTDYVIVTNEDPYDEDPRKIIDEVAKGVEGKKENINFWRILDRREAIKKALRLAEPNDVVILTGKGSEQWIVGKNNQKISWDERKEVRALLQERIGDQSKANSN